MERFEVTITLHNGNVSKLIYNNTKENMPDIVWNLWYTGFLEVNPDNPKRKIHIQPTEIKSIQFNAVKE